MSNSKTMKSLYKKLQPKKKVKRKLPKGMTLADHCRSIGMIKSKAKSEAARKNGKMGGRPKKVIT